MNGKRSPGTDKRFLRDPGLRAALYSKADGKCESCGKPLDRDWTADHVIPWVFSRRTNVFEMAALCPACNVAKGATMPDQLADFTVDTSKFRIGQREAFETTIGRVRADERYTAIVLPTRYGKTDFMRVTGLELNRLGLTSSTMIVTPGKFLREQALRDSDLEKMLKLYGMNVSIRKYEVIRAPNIDLLVKADLIAATTSMAKSQVDVFQHWIALMCAKFKKPPMVFFDEAHMSSVGNQWGQTMQAFAEAGAFICLGTATPYRTDEENIPGFQLERAETLHQTTSAGGRIYEREVERYQLKAHHVTTFRDAWDEGGTLCKIAQHFVPVRLSDVDEAEYGYTWLSDLSIADSDRILGRVVRHPIVVRDTCAVLADELTRFRRLAPATAGIVFVGNDAYSESDDLEADGHARRVREALATHGLKAIIATSSETSQGTEAIEEFRATRQHDVLIVKQMASRGIDIPKLKVALDLSPARAAQNAFVQRSMRIATRWQFEGAKVLGNATYIAPHDVRIADLFDRLISDQGGEYTARSDWRDAGADVGQERDRTAYRYDPRDFEVVDTGVPEFVTDSDHYAGKGEFLPYIDTLIEEEPELRHLTTARLLNAFGTAVEHYNASIGVMDPPDSEPRIADDQAVLEDLYSKLNDEVMRIAKWELRDQPAEARRQAFGATVSAIWGRVGVNDKGKLRSITDPERLRAMLGRLESMGGATRNGQ